MGKVRATIVMSLDGFVAGPEQSLENPLGLGGMQLHDWAVELAAWRRAHGLEGGVENASTPVVEEAQANVGAYVMGRNMFGGGPGPWGEDPWKGWWGDEPPYHAPVVVVTHHAREPLAMEGGTTFSFVTDGVESAVAQARAAAGDRNVHVVGGASAIGQALAAGLVDELDVSVVPLLLGSGARLFEGVGTGVRLEQERVIEAPGVTHLRYRVVA